MKERASKPVARGRDQDDRPFKLRLFIPDPAIRSITWQRTTEMYGTIQRYPEASWEQIEQALAAECYYANEDGSICVHDEGRGVLAVIDPDCQDRDEEGYTDAGFVLGDGG